MILTRIIFSKRKTMPMMTKIIIMINFNLKEIFANMKWNICIEMTSKLKLTKCVLTKLGVKEMVFGTLELANDLVCFKLDTCISKVT